MALTYEQALRIVRDSITTADIEGNPATFDPPAWAIRAVESVEATVRQLIEKNLAMLDPSWLPHVAGLPIRDVVLRGLAITRSSGVNAGREAAGALYPEGG